MASVPKMTDQDKQIYYNQLKASGMHYLDAHAKAFGDKSVVATVDKSREPKSAKDESTPSTQQ